MTRPGAPSPCFGGVALCHLFREYQPMQKLLPTTSLGLGHSHARHHEAPAAESASLLLALWRRKWTLLLTVFVCVGAASAYLLVAQRVFSATATVMIDQNNVKA